jgi:hypothetical protein
MAFPETSVLDDFNRSNTGPPLGGNWTPGPLTEAGIAIVSNQASIAGDSVDRNEYWSAAQFGPDCEAYITIADIAAAGAVHAAMVGCRLNPDEYDGYCVQVTAQYSMAGLFRVDNEAYTPLGDLFEWTPADGDSIGISAIGTTIKAYLKLAAGAWTEKVSVTDTTYQGAGYIWTGGYAQGDNGIKLDNFGGGTIGGVARIPRHGFAESGMAVY